MDNKLLYRRATRLVQWILQFIKFNLYAQADYRRSNTHSPFSNFTWFTWSLDFRIEFAEYLSEYPLCDCSNFRNLIWSWDELALSAQKNRRSLHSLFPFSFFSRFSIFYTDGRNYWPSTTVNFSRGAEDFFSCDRRNFHAGKCYRSLTSERLVSSMM